MSIVSIHKPFNNFDLGASILKQTLSAFLAKLFCKTVTIVRHIMFKLLILFSTKKKIFLWIMSDESENCVKILKFLAAPTISVLFHFWEYYCKKTKNIKLFKKISWTCPCVLKLWVTSKWAIHPKYKKYEIKTQI